jgi:hypothetical protein
MDAFRGWLYYLLQGLNYKPIPGRQLYFYVLKAFYLHSILKERSTPFLPGWLNKNGCARI